MKMFMFTYVGRHYFGIRNRVTLLVLIATTKFPVLWHPYSACHSKLIISHLIPQEMVQQAPKAQTQSKCPVQRSICLGKWYDCQLSIKVATKCCNEGESNQKSLFFVLFNAVKLSIFNMGDFMAIVASLKRSLEELQLFQPWFTWFDKVNDPDL